MDLKYVPPSRDPYNYPSNLELNVLSSEETSLTVSEIKLLKIKSII